MLCFTWRNTIIFNMCDPIAYMFLNKINQKINFILNKVGKKEFLFLLRICFFVFVFFQLKKLD